MKRTAAIFVLVFLITTSFAPAPAGPPTAWRAKVDSWLLDKARQAAKDGNTPVEFLVFLSEQADLSGAAALQTKQEKGAYVFSKLTETARRTQPAVIRDLASRGVAYRPFWVANMLWVRGDLSVIQAMAQRPDVAHVYANPQVKIQLPNPIQAASIQAPQGIQWNIQQVNANQVWAAGFTGQGTVVAGADTGIYWRHPALISHYRGWNSSSANHNYNWHDAVHDSPSTSPCPNDSLVPCDGYFIAHGTHTMGTMVGDDGAGNQIGMAPGAKWIGCRNMDNNGNGTPERYSECFEWFIAPYALGADPTSGNPNLAPDVVNNSWGCPSTEGCTDPNALLTVINNVRAAGILVVASAGNSGYLVPNCSTVNTPPAIYASSFTVGATDSGDHIAGFSSRGPVTVDGSSRLKPDISAPGVGVYSSITSTVGTLYGSLEGTSMAAPHVAGLAALLISAEPGLHGKVDLLENVIEQTAVPLTTTETCGNTDGLIPNNVFGWGRIDALAAYQATRDQLFVQKTASESHIMSGGFISYTLTVSHTNILLPTYSVILTDVIPIHTAVITATMPFTAEDGAVRWDFASLGMDQTKEVSLTLQVPITVTGVIVNRAFVSSQEVALTASAPVTTRVGWAFYFPLVGK